MRPRFAEITGGAAAEGGRPPVILFPSRSPSVSNASRIISAASQTAARKKSSFLSSGFHYYTYYQLLCICIFWCRHITNVFSRNGSRIVPSTSREHHSAQNFTPDRLEATKIPKTPTRSPKMKKNIDMFRHRNLQIAHNYREPRRRK